MGFNSGFKGLTEILEKLCEYDLDSAGSG